MTTRRVTIIFWDGYFSVAPALVSALNMLAAAGYEVTLLLHAPLDGTVYAPPPKLADAVTVCECRTIIHWSESLRRRLPGRVYSLFFFAGLLQFIIYCLFKTAFKRYQSFIGVESNALIAATIAGRLKRTPVIYWSFELWLIYNRRPGWFNNTLRAIEKRLNRAAQYILIQDQYRIDMVMKTYGIPRAKFILVPNGLRGSATATKSSGTHQAFQKMFSLPDNTRVVLHAGMISPFTIPAELIQAVKTWPAIYSLVLHERRKRDKDEPALKQIAEAGQGRIHLSLDPVPTEQLDELISSGDVGLVIYIKDGSSAQMMLTGASGKLAQYLRCGLPIIGVDMPGMRDLLAEFQCGVCIKTMDDIGPALDVIFADYARYSANALRCFEERYEFDRHFAKVLTVIEANTR